MSSVTSSTSDSVLISMDMNAWTETFDDQLIYLPDLVVEKILSYLDPPSLKKLRLVCRRTKSWVEIPKYLQKYKMNISNRTHLLRVMNYGTPWTNFALHSESFFAMKRYMETLQILTHIEICDDGRNIQSCAVIIDLLCVVGSKLQSLIISHVAIPLGFKISQESLKSLKTNLSGLKHLAVGRISEHSQYQPVLFVSLLKCCSSSLASLKLPFFTIPNSRDDCQLPYPNNLPMIEKCREAFMETYEALFAYLCLRASSPESKNSDVRTFWNDLCIDLCQPSSTTLNQRIVFPSMSLITRENLYDLVQVCSRIGGRLQNVPCTALPEKSQILVTEENIWENCLESIAVLNTESGVQSNIYIPPTSKVRVFMDVNETQIFNLFHLTNQIHEIRYIYHHVSMSQIPYCINALLTQLFGTPHPSVEELTLHLSNIDDYFPSGFELVRNFQNLKKLALKGWTIHIAVKFKTLAEGLHNLEYLSLEEYNVRDEDILGSENENPSILQLKKLTTLSFIWCGYYSAGLTDACFQRAFKYMRLKTFVFTSNYSKVTYTGGISALGSVKDGFRDSIETFECDIPEDVTKDTMDCFIRGFSRINSCILHDIRSPHSYNYLPDLQEFQGPVKLSGLQYLSFPPRFIGM